MITFRVKFTYYKPTGKYYTDGHAEIDAPNLYELFRAVKQRLDRGDNPGLLDNSVERNGFYVVVDGEQLYPTLYPEWALAYMSRDDVITDLVCPECGHEYKESLPPERAEVVNSGRAKFRIPQLSPSPADDWEDLKEYRCPGTVDGKHKWVNHQGVAGPWKHCQLCKHSQKSEVNV